MTWCLWGDVVGHVWLAFRWDIDRIETSLTAGGCIGVLLRPVIAIVGVIEFVVDNGVL
jgi:hypothetical protein